MVSALLHRGKSDFCSGDAPASQNFDARPGALNSCRDGLIDKDAGGRGGASWPRVLGHARHQRLSKALGDCAGWSGLREAWNVGRIYKHPSWSCLCLCSLHFHNIHNYIQDASVQRTHPLLLVVWTCLSNVSTRLPSPRMRPTTTSRRPSSTSRTRAARSSASSLSSRASRRFLSHPSISHADIPQRQGPRRRRLHAPVQRQDHRRARRRGHDAIERHTSNEI